MTSKSRPLANKQAKTAPTKELARHLFYETHKHNLGPEEVKQFFELLKSNGPLDEVIRSFIETWEDFLELFPKTHAMGDIVYPGVRCVHCDEGVSFRDEGQDVECIWVHQGQKESAGIYPVTYCVLPYYVVGKVLEKHPEWKSRIRSACNVCGEEITFPTNHSCLVPDWMPKW